MLSAHVADALVALATVLLAIVIFAPERPARTPAFSCAPPMAPPPADAWPLPSPALEPAFEAAPLPEAPPLFDVSDHASWPTLIDAAASDCDAAARRALVDALADVCSPWADAIIARAARDDPSASVRAAASAARRD